MAAYVSAHHQMVTTETFCQWKTVQMTLAELLSLVNSKRECICSTTHIFFIYEEKCVQNVFPVLIWYGIRSGFWQKSVACEFSLKWTCKYLYLIQKKQQKKSLFSLPGCPIRDFQTKLHCKQFEWWYHIRSWKSEFVMLITHCLRCFVLFLYCLFKTLCDKTRRLPPPTPNLVKVIVWKKTRNCWTAVSLFFFSSETYVHAFYLCSFKSETANDISCLLFRVISLHILYIGECCFNLFICCVWKQISTFIHCSYSNFIFIL